MSSDHINLIVISSTYTSISRVSLQTLSYWCLRHLYSYEDVSLLVRIEVFSFVSNYGIWTVLLILNTFRTKNLRKESNSSSLCSVTSPSSRHMTTTRTRVTWCQTDLSDLLWNLTSAVTAVRFAWYLVRVVRDGLDPQSLRSPERSDDAGADTLDDLYDC